MALGRFEEAFQAASEVLRRTDRDLATLATQHMAECLVWQGRVQEALELYVGLKRRLPCRLVDEKRIQTGITNCMSHLERRRAITKPS
jgi:tetratricopeptide (TPR) repeat protein